MIHSKSKRIVLGMLIAFAGLQGLQAETAKKDSIWSYCAINPESPIKDRQKFEELLKVPTLTFLGIVNEIAKGVGMKPIKSEKAIDTQPLYQTLQSRAKRCESGKILLALMRGENT